MARLGSVEELTLAGLRVCREIALLGSFTAAARSLGYSQPADLAAGRRHGGRRRAGTVRPQRARGQPQPRRCRGCRARGPHPGRRLIRCGTTSTASATGWQAECDWAYFPPRQLFSHRRAIARLNLDHPGLTVLLSEASTPTLLRELRSGRLDVAVIGAGAGLADYDLSGLATHRVFAGDLCVAVPVGHRLAAAARVAVHELVGEPGSSARARRRPAVRGLADADRSGDHPPGKELAGAAGARRRRAGHLSDTRTGRPIGARGRHDGRGRRPDWLGRVTLAVTRSEPTNEVRAMVDAIQAAGRGIRAGVSRERG